MHTLNPEPRAQLTLRQFEALARRVNNGWVKWWSDWNHAGGQLRMAISCINHNAHSIDYPELERMGFERTVAPDGEIVYVCERAEGS